MATQAFTSRPSCRHACPSFATRSAQRLSKPTCAGREPQGTAGPVSQLALLLSVGATVFHLGAALPVYADDDAFERRQAAAEKRRELLRQTREAAEAKTAVALDAAKEDLSAPSVSADAEDPSNAVRRADMLQSKIEMEKSKSDTIRSYEQQAAKSFRLPVAEEPKEPMFSAPSLPFSMPSFTAPSFSFSSSDDESSKTADAAAEVKPAEIAKPAPVFSAPPPPPAPIRTPPPPPPPAPVYQARTVEAPPAARETRKAEVKEVKQAAAVDGKRHGPLPGWLAEFLVIGFFAAWGAAVTKFSKETTDATQAAAKLIKAVASKANLI